METHIPPRNKKTKRQEPRQFKSHSAPAFLIVPAKLNGDNLSLKVSLPAGTEFEITNVFLKLKGISFPRMKVYNEKNKKIKNSKKSKGKKAKTKL